MKELSLYILLLLFGIAWAQDEEMSEPDVESDASMSEILEDPCSQCVCPEVEQTQQSYQLFPPQSVFLISPLPENPVQVVPEKKTSPGYIEHLESGYSDGDYKQIPPSD